MMIKARNWNLFWYKLCCCAGFGFFLFLAQVQAADVKPEVYYITTHLQLGLHTLPAMDSPVVELVSGGESISILKAEKKFSQVQLKDGSKGWLASQFITLEQPAESRVAELEVQLQKLQQQLQGSSPAAADAADKDNALEQKITDYKETIAGLKEELKAWEQLDFQDRQAQKENARQINQQLKQRLSKIAALATVQDSEKTNMIMDNESLSWLKKASFFNKGWFKKEYLLAVVIGGAGFILGLFIMDIINRRRHGGYRI